MKFDVDIGMKFFKGLALQFDKDYCGWWRLWHDFYWFTTKNGILRISKPKTTSQACFQISFSDWTVNQSNKNPIENSIKFLENDFRCEKTVNIFSNKIIDWKFSISKPNRIQINSKGDFYCLLFIRKMQTKWRRKKP